MGLIRIELREDESLTSFCSRLAVANARTAYELCQDFGFTFRKVVDGDDDAISSLSEISGVGRELLDAAAVKRVGDYFVSVGGDPTPWVFHPRAAVRFCPSCFAEDDQRVDLRPRTRSYGRKMWFSRFIRTCPIHSQSLVSAGIGSNPNHNHDYCSMLGELRREVVVAAATSITREFSAFEQYILGRLRGEKPGNDFLDQLPIYVAGDICEVAGMVVLYGKKVRTRTKTDEEFWQAASAGFEFFKEGLTGLHRFLDSLYVQEKHPRAYYGGGQLYGAFHTFLAEKLDSPAYDPVRDAVRTYAYSSLPLTDTSTIFGKFEKPRYLSFASFERKYGITGFLLKKVLLTIGRYTTLPGSNIEVIDADSAELVADTIRDLVRAAEGAALIGISYTVFVFLVEEGIIVPAIPQDHQLKISTRFSKRELIRFRDDLLSKGNPDHTAGLNSIKDVTRSLACSYIDLLRLLLQNEVTRIGIDRRKSGLMSLMFDREEIKGKIRGDILQPHHGCLTAVDLSKRWKTSPNSVYALMRNDHIETRIELNPDNRMLQKVMTIEAVEAFERRYISLAECCKRSGLSPPRASKKLRADGLARTFPKEQMKDAFYLRDPAEAALGLNDVMAPDTELAEA